MTMPPLISVRLLSLLASEKVKVLNHPPYSPDLSPCDFFLFPRLKKMLSQNKYMSYSLVVRADKENEDSLQISVLKRCPTNKIHEHIEQDLTQNTNVQIQIHRT